MTNENKNDLPKVKAKKSLGQHFLIDRNIAAKIVESLNHKGNVLEIGPGMGILTDLLLQKNDLHVKLIEIDPESCDYLLQKFPSLKSHLIREDFLKIEFSNLFEEPFAIIGNFPYNISSQILFKVYDNPDWVTEVTGMFQREVARRIVSPPGNKDYGILSVLMQAFYSVEYLFTVPETVFSPPPRVKSGVIRLLRKPSPVVDFPKEKFTMVVKTAFNQRRKTLRNALSKLYFEHDKESLSWMDKRAEQLHYTEFVRLAQLLQIL